MTAKLMCHCVAFVFSLHSDLSMNNITELPANVFKKFPYLEELWVHALLSRVKDVFTLYSVDMSAVLYETHLGIWIHTAGRTASV